MPDFGGAHPPREPGEDAPGEGSDPDRPERPATPPFAGSSARPATPPFAGAAPASEDDASAAAAMEDAADAAAERPFAAGRAAAAAAAAAPETAEPAREPETAEPAAPPPRHTISGCGAEVVVHDNEYDPPKSRVHPGVEFGLVVDPEELGYIEYQFRCERVLENPASRVFVFETEVMGAGEVFSHTFSENGRYEVFDVDAPDAVGRITVTDEDSDED